MSYQKLIHINELNFRDRKVIIVGAGWMADQYCQALQAMGIRLVTVETFNPDDRILCPDGTCTGIIEDGRCSECGRPHTEEHPKGD
jgi:glutamate dehydrogenase/leucine dehydrogenase